MNEYLPEIDPEAALVEVWEEKTNELTAALEEARKALTSILEDGSISYDGLTIKHEDLINKALEKIASALGS